VGNLILVAIQFATNVQLKDLTHKFWSLNFISQIILKRCLSCVLTLEYMCQFGMSLKKIISKDKT
jgi:hypothetical protein